MKKSTSIILELLVLAIVIAIVFYPLLNADFINYDDPMNVINNSHIQIKDLGGILELFKITIDNHYTPLTYVSYALDYSNYSLNPAGFHVTNVILHLLNTFLVFYFLRLIELRRWGALLGALIFAVHPISMEAVAWISARNYLLAAFFALSSSALVINFYRTERLKWLYYLGSIVFYGMCILSGRMYMFLPCLFLIYLYYNGQLSKWKWLLPYFGMSFITGVMSIKFAAEITDKSSHIQSSFMGGVNDAMYGLVTNLFRFVLPLKTTIYHSQKLFIDKGYTQIFMIFIIIVLVVLWVIRGLNRRSASKYIWIYSILIFPTLKFSFFDFYGGYIIADRYCYLPFIGLIIILLLFTQKLKIMIPSCILVILIFSVATWKRSFTFRDSGSIWEECLKVFPTNSFALNNLATYQASINDFNSAKNNFKKAMLFDPNYFQPLLNLGNVYYSEKKYDSAIFCYNTMLIRDPENNNVLKNRGILYYTLDSCEKSTEDLERLFQKDPFMKGLKSQLDKSRSCLIEQLELLDSNETNSYVKELKFLKGDATKI